MMQRFHLLWKEHRSLLLFLSLMVLFRSVIADWNTVPTGSMKPTILEGDRILVNKMAYDIRIPFSHRSPLKRADPARGDSVIFNSAVVDKRLVERVVGLPRDRVAMVDNHLWVNGRKLGYRDDPLNLGSSDKIEDLLGIEHRVCWLGTQTRLSSFRPLTVPPDHYLQRL
ncbi:MAG: signal peptidase I [gamma proteobacterium symbiont of Ctena orbiculata]|nr:MAG: signal peptidase I [gamma proteobacterium symbiont of Ctena orbiculata]